MRTLATFRINSNTEVIITTWSNATPYRVCVYNVTNDEYLNGVYCGKIGDAFKAFNEKINDNLVYFSKPSQD